jgi:hypothetical protein
MPTMPGPRPPEPDVDVHAPPVDGERARRLHPGEHEGGLRQAEHHRHDDPHRHRDVHAGRRPPTAPQRQEQREERGPGQREQQHPGGRDADDRTADRGERERRDHAGAGTTSSTTATANPQATAKFAMPPPMASEPGPRRNTAETNAATGSASTGRRRTAGSAQKPATTVVATAITTSAIACVYATSSGPSHVSSGPISSSTTPAATAWKPCG